MQVLGDLIRLPTDGSLPLPWWQRAPLGFLHGTNLYVGVAESLRPVGDIVVSTLDITKWDNILRVDCTHREERGVLAKLMEAVLPLNIALAETVTTESGKEHHATLFCEGQSGQKVKDAIMSIKAQLQKGSFREFNLDPYLSPTSLILHQTWSAMIDHGWLRSIPWMVWFRENYDEPKLNAIDLTQAVVSADTENRLLRFVFPYKGARTVKISHADQPGALREILWQFAACDLNILSALLRRGGQKPGHAELIAVCEPRATQNPLEVYQELQQRILDIDRRFAAVARVEDAYRPAETVIYLPSPHPAAVPRGTRLLYFDARHSASNDWESRLGTHVRWILEGSGYSLEAMTAADAGQSAGDRISQRCSAVDSAEACIFLVTGFDALERLCSEELLYELGYVRALSKPALLLTESNATALVTDWSRGERFTYMQFAPGDEAFDSSNPASLDRLVQSWLSRLSEQVSKATHGRMMSTGV